MNVQPSACGPGSAAQAHRQPPPSRPEHPARRPADTDGTGSEQDEVDGEREKEKNDPRRDVDPEPLRRRIGV